MTTPEPLIDVQELTMGWGDFILQRDATFQVNRGDVFVILGGSGCGKSTLLRSLIGLQPPLSGSVHVAGIGTPSMETVGRPPFGVMFQAGALFGSMSIGENVALPIRSWTDLPPDAVDAVVRSRLRLVGLDGYEHHLPSEISGGMKKRAAIARAMALEPELLFLDEPSAGLDPISAVELDELILTLNRTLGLTVVLVTHELESIFKIGSTCLFLDKDTKSILARGDPRVLRDTSDDLQVRSFFNRTAPEKMALARDTKEES